MNNVLGQQSSIDGYTVDDLSSYLDGGPSRYKDLSTAKKHPNQ